MSSRSRKHEILLEILSDKDFYHEQIVLPKSQTDAYRQDNIIYPIDNNFYYQNRFVVKMETEDFIIKSDRIKGFRIENSGISKVLKIKTFLHVDEWVEDFQHVDIIKIYFFDMRGNLMKNSFDYDVDYKGFSLGCDYKFFDYLTPIFEYNILDFEE